MKQELSPYTYRDGLIAGIPIALGYLIVSIGFGITAVTSGIKIAEAMLISMTNLTSAGQVAGTAIIAAGGTVLEMILTQLVINIRYSLMGITLSQNLDCRCTAPRRMLLSMTITDEIFGVAASKPHPVGPAFLYGLATLPYFGWAGGTFIGAFAGQIMPDDVRLAAGIIIYAMFIAIVIPQMRTDRGVLIGGGIAVALSCCFAFLPKLNLVSSGFAVIICSVVAAAIVSFFCPTPDEPKEADKHEN